MTAGTITIIQGEDFTLNLAFTEADESPYDLTGCTVRLIVRRNTTTTPVIDKPVTSHINAVGGLTAIPLANADTDIAIRAWKYQVILVGPDGNDRPSGVHDFMVTNVGSTTDSVGVTIGSNDVTVTLTLAGAAGAGIAAGGTTGQVLTKTTNADYDTGWTTPAQAVSSVAGRTGAVILTATDITDFDTKVANNTDVAANTAARHTHANQAVLNATTASFTTADETKLDGVATGATANSPDATLLARANHTGTQSADTIVDGTTNKAYTATEKTKLAGIATGATANSSDATLLSRANHTGSQAQSTVTNLVTDLAAKAPLASPALTGTPIAPTPTAGDNSTKISTTAFVAAASTTDRARANHTGTQTASTISDFSTAADARITNAAGTSIASLSSGKVPTSQLPAVSLVTVQTAASQAAPLALTAQEGDVVVRTDENKTYMRNNGTAGTMADYTLLNTPTDSVTSVNGQTGVVSLAKGDVGLGNVDNTADAAKPVSTATQSALNLKS